MSEAWSPNETAAMGFPSDCDFSGTKTKTIEQIGNAVPVNLERALCEQLLVGRDPTIHTYLKDSSTGTAPPSTSDG